MAQIRPEKRGAASTVRTSVDMLAFVLEKMPRSREKDLPLCRHRLPGVILHD